MIRVHTKAFLATAAAVLFAASALPAATIYDNTASPRFGDPGDSGPLYFNDNDFTNSSDYSNHILWSSVPVAVGANVNPGAVISKVSLDISRLANAQGFTYSIYWADMVPDNGTNRGVSNSSAFNFDSPLDDPGTAHLLGTGTLAANGNAYGRTTISVGDGVNTLFTTGTLDTTTPDYNYTNDDYETGLHPGFGYFYVGLKMTPNGATEDNGWTVASSPNSLFLITDDFQDASPSTIGDFYYGTDTSNNPVEGTQMMSVLGTVVPEPTTLSLLGLAGVGVIARRRRA